MFSSIHINESGLPRQLVGLLLLWWMMGIHLGVYAQSEGTTTTPVTTHQYADEEWENLQQQLDYTGKPTKPKEEPAKQANEEEPSPPSNDRNFTFSEEWSMLMKVLFFAILGVALIFLIRAILNNGEQRFSPAEATRTKPKVNENLLSLEELVEQLDTTNVDPYIREAEVQQQYDLAIRLQFLAVLRQLHQHGYIQWKKDRTNRTYLQQLYGQAPYQTFRELSLIYEYYWYGHHLPNANTYTSLKARYEDFITQLEPLTQA